MVSRVAWIIRQKQTPRAAQLPRAGAVLCAAPHFLTEPPGRQALFLSSHETRELRLRDEGPVCGRVLPLGGDGMGQRLKATLREGKGVISADTHPLG